MSSLSASKVPLDRNAGMIHATTPSPDFSPERCSIPDPALAQALPRKQTDGDLGLVQPASRLLAKAFDHCLASMRVQIVQHQMDGVGLGIVDGDIQQVVGKFSRRAVPRHLGKVPSGFRLHPAEHVDRAAALVFTVSASHSPRPHGLGRANFLVQHHRLLIHTNHRFPLAPRLFIKGQDVLHAPDILFIQFRHAPHFFPATASGRGFAVGRGSSPVPPVARVCVSPLLRSAGAPSNARGLGAAGHRPARRCVADPAPPASSLFPAVAARTRHVPVRLAESVGWSAIPSSELRRRSWPPAGRSVPRPAAARPKPAARFAPAAIRSVTSAVTPVVPAWTTESEIARSCPSYSSDTAPGQVPICITNYVV